MRCMYDLHVELNHFRTQLLSRTLNIQNSIGDKRKWILRGFLARFRRYGDLNNDLSFDTRSKQNDKLYQIF